MDKESKTIVREFCTEIRLWRRDLGLSQAELARRIDASPSWISMMERGDILPDYSTRTRIRLALEKQEFYRSAKRRKRMNAPTGAER
jgi:predicted transcriptional regulator